MSIGQLSLCNKKHCNRVDAINLNITQFRKNTEKGEVGLDFKTYLLYNFFKTELSYGPFSCCYHLHMRIEQSWCHDIWAQRSSKKLCPDSLKPALRDKLINVNTQEERMSLNKLACMNRKFGQKKPLPSLSISTMLFVPCSLLSCFPFLSFTFLNFYSVCASLALKV